MKSLFLACSVCFGDPHSSLSKGAFLGALFLLATAGLVLSAIAGIAFTWARRSQRLQSLRK